MRLHASRRIVFGILKYVLGWAIRVVDNALLLVMYVQCNVIYRSTHIPISHKARARPISHISNSEGKEDEKREDIDLWGIDDWMHHCCYYPCKGRHEQTKCAPNESYQVRRSDRALSGPPTKRLDAGIGSARTPKSLRNFGAPVLSRALQST